MQEDGEPAGMEETLQEACPRDAVESLPPSAPLLNGQLPVPGISVLDRLIKTCPVWLQLCMSPEQAADILLREAPGVFLVTRDVEMKCMTLWVHYPDQKTQADHIRFNIREQRTMMYLEGSMLVFKDIFKLVAFYCVSRDILPSPLRLPYLISGAQTFKDLEVISNLGTGFWDSSIRHQRGSNTCPSGTSSMDPHGKCELRGLGEARGCTCELAVNAGNDKLWFVDPIFIEECSNLQTSGKLPQVNSDVQSDSQLPKIVYRRPPPPPPPPPPSLHKPPLPSVPPSAPPPNYRPSHPHVGSPSHSDQSSSGSKPSPSSPTPPTESVTLFDLSEPSSSKLLSSSSTPPSPKVEPLSLDSLTGATSLSSPPNSIPSDPVSLDCASTEPISNILSCPGSTPLSAVPQKDTPLAPSTSETENKAKDLEGTSGVDPSPGNMRINNVEEKKDHAANEGSKSRTPSRVPPAVPRRRQSGKSLDTKSGVLAIEKDLQGRPSETSSDLKVFKPEPKTLVKEVCGSDLTQLDSKEATSEEQRAKSQRGQKSPPIPPPRRNRLSSRKSSTRSGIEKVDHKNNSDAQQITKNSDHPGGSENMAATEKRFPPKEQKGSDLSLNSSDPCSPMSNPEPDSISNSSAEEDTERPVGSSLKKSHSFMLDRAKNRLSIVAISNVFTAFMSADRKLGKRIGELAHDKDSYFGNLVQDYKAYSLEMMAKQSSSTEMLQEIRLMMTQLKSYLVQSTELKSMVDYNIYTDDKIDTIVEAALCKCVLKPLKSPIECYLRDIHNKDGSLRLLTENQLVIQDTTTTDLGVTTSVPDTGVMEKITQKFLTMHKTYSPEKKITYLLKSCKLIYDSMATGNPGKPHGADDFLPVLMYVLARCDLVALLLDVEYMMELMDPALQLGEGSYYLTTTYGALEHIKNYDKITVTRQLSLEVQDSIHRWERRRTLNKAKVSRSSIQDFITISFEELDSRTRTFATRPETSVAEVLRQCAEKFEVADPQNYALFVVLRERCLRLADDAFPHQVKSSLLRNEQKLDFHFLYKMSSLQDSLLRDLDSI